MVRTLVILAAGSGRRFGGHKQLDMIGPSGATIMDCSIYDALRSGFGRIVFVIRPELETHIRERLAAVRAARAGHLRFPAAGRPARRVRAPCRTHEAVGYRQAVLSAAAAVDGPLAARTA